MSTHTTLSPTAAAAMRRHQCESRTVLALQVQNSQLRDLLRRWVIFCGDECDPESELMRDTREAGVE